MSQPEQKRDLPLRTTRGLRLRAAIDDEEEAADSEFWNQVGEAAAMQAQLESCTTFQLIATSNSPAHSLSCLNCAPLMTRGVPPPPLCLNSERSSPLVHCPEIPCTGPPP